MSSTPLLPAISSIPFVDPEPLIVSGRNWTAWFGTLVSLAVLGVVLWQLRGLDLHEVVASLGGGKDS